MYERILRTAKRLKSLLVESDLDDTVAYAETLYSLEELIEFLEECERAPEDPDQLDDSDPDSN